jgi:ABC-type nitrate/sulfonate/bicarbonate transport system substrate-binding protein
MRLALVQLRSGIATGALLALALVAPFPQALAQAKPELTAVKIGATNDPQIGGPWVIAKEKGFFASEGLTQGDVVLFSSGPQSFPPFVAGDLQGDSSGDQPMYTQAAGGVQLKLLAIYSEISGVHGVVASSNVKSVKDLDGKNVGLAKASTAEWYMRSLCKNYGCDVSKMKILAMAPPEAVTAIVSGDIDVFSGWQPFLDRAIEAGKAKGVHFIHYGNTSYFAGAEGPKKVENSFAVFYVTTKFLNENPRTVEAMLRALDKACNFINTNKAEAAKIIARVYKNDEAQMERWVSAIQFGILVNDERMKFLQENADLLYNEKLIRQRLDMKTVLDAGPLKKVKPEAVVLGQ